MTSVLAISAHPDDAELGCGGYIQHFSERRIVVLSQGERGGAWGTRKAEQMESAKVLRAETGLYDLRDTAIDLMDAAEILEAEIADYRPTTILTMAPHDTHQDHSTVYRATMVAVRDYPCTVLAYVGPSSAAAFAPTWFVPLTTQEMAVKQAALACHHSQSARSYMVPEAVEGMARYWSMVMRAKAQYVEPFLCVRAWG